ncbi:malonic semialdehyde reductase [Bowmanella pacifica]|uniref:Malonic semialdehyde reductase RutE n=1 Tax=Bowmanella pacifica TaxID=502051 RepID=A0A917YTD8_9ALTE|nr:malonic semialdehyde reductase [Bowmanella pacifica]GGO65535.1 putative malonic semialdehyde reductase RutE [Bowmanella pacifica]
MNSPAISHAQQQAIDMAQAAATKLREEFEPLSPKMLDQILCEARSHNGWLDKPVAKQTLRQLYEIVKMGSTSMNSCPARFVFIQSEQAKQKLKACLAPLNVNKVLSAPVTVIVAHDLAFYEKMDKLFAHNPGARQMMADNAKAAEITAFRNGTLQGAYLMIAARALGLDVGPMSGFNNQACDDAFFAGTRIRSNFLCCLGYGDTTKLFQRLPRLDFDEACQIS